MSVALAVLLCRLFVTCAGITAGILVKGVCSTAVAVYQYSVYKYEYMYCTLRANQLYEFYIYMMVSSCIFYM